MTFGSPPSMTATTEFVVPRSIPMIFFTAAMGCLRERVSASADHTPCLARSPPRRRNSLRIGGLRSTRWIAKSAARARRVTRRCQVGRSSSAGDERAVLLDLAVERALGDAERLRGLLAVAAAGAQGVADEDPLGLL